jgi:hypothetical protein
MLAEGKKVILVILEGNSTRADGFDKAGGTASKVFGGNLHCGSHDGCGEKETLLFGGSMSLMSLISSHARVQVAFKLL